MIAYFSFPSLKEIQSVIITKFDKLVSTTDIRCTSEHQDQLSIKMPAIGFLLQESSILIKKNDYLQFT
jgi:hypothetical protein